MKRKLSKIHKNCEIKNAYEGLISNYTNIVVKLLDTHKEGLWDLPETLKLPDPFRNLKIDFENVLLRLPY